MSADPGSQIHREKVEKRYSAVPLLPGVGQIKSRHRYVQLSIPLPNRGVAMVYVKTRVPIYCFSADQKKKMVLLAENLAV